MENKFIDLANNWASKNNINIVFAEWSQYQSGFICISNTEVYYSSIKELDEIMNEHGCCVWTLDKSNYEHENAIMDIWIRLK